MLKDVLECHCDDAGGVHKEVDVWMVYLLQKMFFQEAFILTETK